MIMTMYIIVQKYCSFSTKMYLSYEIRNNSNYDDFTLHSRRIMICTKIWLIELFAKVFELLPCIAYVIRNRFESSCYWVVRKVSFVSRGNNRRFLFYIILSNYVRSMLFYRDKHRDILQTWFHVCMKMHRCKRHVCERKTLSGQPNILAKRKTNLWIYIELTNHLLPIIKIFKRSITRYINKLHRFWN